jgi:copper transport protein
VSPARKGPVEIAIQLQTMEEKPLVAKAVSVTLTGAGNNANLKIVEAERRGADKWLARVTLPAAGRWTLGLGISISEIDKVSIEAPIVIE